jgi:outer membrane protein assembly factor BamB
MVDIFNRVVACDNEKIILVNASNPDDVQVEWITNLTLGLTFSPTIVENKTIILPTNRGFLYAFNVSNGQLLAKLKLWDNSSTQPFYGIRKMNWSDFFTILFNLLDCPYHYNSSSHMIEWDSTVPYGIMPVNPVNPVFFDGSIMFITNRDGVVTAVDMTTWSIIASNAIATPELISNGSYYTTKNSACVKGNKVFLVTERTKPGYEAWNNTLGRLYAIEVKSDPTNESVSLIETWNYSFNGSSEASPILINDTIFFDGFNTT